MKYSFLTFIISLFSLVAQAQTTSFRISDPIDLPIEGWNKTLLMHNGNTILFHFERRKPILVKVFDSTGKEIASSREYTASLTSVLLNVLS